MPTLSYGPLLETHAAEASALEPSAFDLRTIARMMRRWVLEQSLKAGVGHIGSSLSVVEILAVLWNRVMRLPATDDPDRDLFVLCKGHAALGLYAAMRAVGAIDAEAFQSFCKDGSPFGVHPEFGVPGVEVTTGSLGQGLSVACGLALALRMRGSPGRVFALLSDAECNEGQVWEAAQFAAHQRLDNLVAVIDCNGMQALGPTADVLDLRPMSRRWDAFGWRVDDVDGHDVDALTDAFEAVPANSGRPTMIVAHTRLGKGVSFMEDRLEWHYRNLTPALAATALSELIRTSL
jgi:transketolase